ncbi:MAG TPA: NrfD/PsrC family molybdoenzyme membrane anchor subunit [Candidatus Binatia bacterium]|jgi:formate-dependent nitrite reductase membrane component NrfD|nr:NrfD/PsrC family molybdoenzyme membrane anchor subunit [Candidatus Binatia bacterium]
MNTFPSSTYFSAPPDWGWLIVFYFFFGGLAGGCYFLAVLIDLFGRPEDRPLARLGYYIAFPCVILSGLLLTLDLQRPLRFWHMLIESNTYRPMFKYWSPMSIGSWALLIFGVFTLISFLGALVEDNRLAWPAWRKVRPPGMLSGVIAVLGGLVGFYVAGYTGVLLAVTNRPIWSDTPLLGMLFVVSAASISAALMVILARRYRWTMPGIAALQRMDAWVVALEFLVLIALMISLGPVFRAWLNAWGLLLFVGVIVVGMLIPLALHWRRQWLGELNLATAAVLVLVGGFILRLVIVFSAQGV